MTFALVAIAIAYLAFGGVLAYALDGSISMPLPRWLQIPVVVVLWPLAIFVVLYAIMDWMARGSH
jgi:hypothetical protein